MSGPDQNRLALLADALRMVSGVVLLTTLLLAPVNYGSTRLLAFETLMALAGIGGVAWLLACGCARTWPLPPVAALIGLALVAIAALAWLVALSPPGVPAFTEAHFARVVRRWPHSVVPREPALLLAWAGAAALSLLALADLAREQFWRRGIAVTLLASGVVVAALGLVQNATGAHGIFWNDDVRMPGAFFGTFFHHTSAGAYLNTVWPLGLGLALSGLQRSRPSPRRYALAGVALGATALLWAAHAGHVSRFPQVIAAAGLVAFLLWTGAWRGLVRGRGRGVRLAMLAVVAVLGALVLTQGATRIGTISARWQLLEWRSLVGGQPAVAPAPASEWPRLMRDDLFVPSDHRQYPLGDRGAAYATAARAIAERPWFGWGPGGWLAAAAAHSADPFIRTFFLYLQFTHNDLLQTLVEWGVIGATGWVLLVPASLVAALRRLRLRPAQDYLGAAAVVALGAVLIQSTIDFPLQIPAIQFNAIALAALAWSVPVARNPAVAVSPLSST